MVSYDFVNFSCQKERVGASRTIDPSGFLGPNVLREPERSADRGLRVSRQFLHRAFPTQKAVVPHGVKREAWTRGGRKLQKLGAGARALGGLYFPGSPFAPAGFMFSPELEGVTRESAPQCEPGRSARSGATPTTSRRSRKTPSAAAARPGAGARPLPLPPAPASSPPDRRAPRRSEAAAAARRQVCCRTVRTRRCRLTPSNHRTTVVVVSNAGRFRAAPFAGTSSSPPTAYKSHHQSTSAQYRRHRVLRTPMQRHGLDSPALPISKPWPNSVPAKSDPPHL